MLISFSRFSFVINRPLLMVPLLIPACALASNGFNLVGYGAESVSMGGADAAIANSPFAVNSNPSGLAQIQGQMLDLSLTEWNQINTHTDQFGNYRKEPKSEMGAWGAGGYVRHIDNTPFTAGIALFIQGGAGWVYKNLDTIFSNAGLGPRDEATSTFGVMKLSPGIGWQINQQFRIGASMGINYTSAAQTLFPATSVYVAPNSPNNFAGINFKDASGFGVNGRIGFQYRPTDDMTIGIDYGTRTKTPIKGGTLRANYSADPAIGTVVRYDDAQLKGFRLPQELSYGIAFRPAKSLLVSLENTWYDWSDVIKDITVVAKSPRSNNLAVPSTLVLNSHVNFRDQHVIKFGFLYDYDEKTKLSFGGNYGSRPIPDESISPIFATIQAPHYMLGMTRKLDDEWTAIGIVEYLPLVHVTYTNATGLWGANAENRHEGVLFHLAANRRW